MFCSKCGTQFKENQKFCAKCGTPHPVISQADTPEVSKAVEVPKVPETVEVPAAPQAVEAPAAPQAVEAPTVPPTVVPRANTSIKVPDLSKLIGLWNETTKKIVIALASAAAALAMVFFVVVPLVNSLKGAKDRNIVFYIDDEKLYALDADNKKAEPVRLSGKLTVDGDVEDGMSRVLMGTKYLKNSNTVLFVDKVDDDDDTYTLKTLKFDKKAAETDPTEIDSEIKGGYILTADEKRLFYLNEEGTFYCHDFKERKRIAKGVESFFVSEDGSFIAYMIDDELYSVDSKSLEAEKVAEDIEYAGFNSMTVDEEGGYSAPALAYADYDSIYVLSKNGNKKIADYDMETTQVTFFSVNEKGEVIYLVDDSEFVSVYDFFEDDLIQSDAQIEEPDENDSKYWKEWDYSWWGTPIVYEYTAEYERLYAQYEEKEEREQLRKEMRSFALPSLSVYYYDGIATKKIADYLDYRILENNFQMYQKDDIILFRAFNPDNFGSMKFSEYYSANPDMSTAEIRGIITGEYYSAYKIFISKGGNVSELNTDVWLSEVRTNSKKTSLYYLFTSDLNSEKDLYKIDLTGDKIGAPELLYTDIVKYCLNDKDEIITARNPIELEEDGDYVSCDLYINDKKIDSDVIIGLDFYDGPLAESEFVHYSSDGTLFYMTDFNNEDEDAFTGKVVQYDGKETKTLAKGAFMFCPVAKDKLFYLDNFQDPHRGSGQLEYYNGGETEKIGRNTNLVFNEQGINLLGYSLDYKDMEFMMD
ncbi:MAG: hypothetical protein IJL87_08880 [Clostridia bacterium]|nr:hypothetical protein [Clostridia bacterium]